jgi:hypothetical protein
MSTVIVPVYRTESGVHNHPVANEQIETRCFDGSNNVTKRFKEVFIYWDGAAWAETPVWDNLLAEIKVALRVDNQCTEEYSYIDYRFNDYRLLDACCIDCPVPLVDAELPEATFGEPYNATVQIQGSGPYQILVFDKAPWVNIVLNPTTGVITFSGTPDEADEVIVQMQAGNCGGGLAPMVEFTIPVLQVLAFTDQEPPNSNAWVDVAYGAGLFVAVSQSGVGNRVMTSPDGANWTQRVSAADNAWNAVCFSPSLNLFVAVATVGIMTSPDGINWTTRVDPDIAQWRDVIWSEELGLFVAVGTLGTNRVMTSPDGITWTTRFAAVMNQWYGVAWSAELGLLVAVGISGTGNRVMTSPDGINWSIGVSPADINWRKVAWHSGMGLFVAVSNTAVGFSQDIMTSPDGITWTLRSNVNDTTLNNIAVVDTIVVAVANIGVPSDKVFSSVDGTNWAVVSASNNGWTGIIYNGFDTVVIVGSGVVASASWIS